MERLQYNSPRHRTYNPLQFGFTRVARMAPQNVTDREWGMLIAYAAERVRAAPDQRSEWLLVARLYRAACRDAELYREQVRYMQDYILMGEINTHHWMGPNAAQRYEIARGWLMDQPGYDGRFDH